MVTKPRSKRATSSQRKAGASHDFDAGGSDEDEKPKQAKPKAKPNADAKPRGKPPKGAKSNQPHSSQRESSRKSDSDSEKEGDDSDSEKEGDDVKMHDSDADADSKFDANADAKARNLPKAARQSSTQRGKGSKKADHNFDDGKATYQFYYLITA